MALLAAALAAGVTVHHLGAPTFLAPFLLLSPLLPIPTWSRPVPGSRAPWLRAAVAVAMLAGWLHASAWGRAWRADCRLVLPDGAGLRVTGVVKEPPRRGRSRLAAEDGLPGGCLATIRVRVTGKGGAGLTVGRRVKVVGRWRRWSSEPLNPLDAGELRVVEVGEVGEGGEAEVKGDVDEGAVRRSNSVGSAAGRTRWLRWRAAPSQAVHRMFPRHAELVEALVLARKEGLAPSVREAFARSGTAHLLAISGFHVGVVAALVLGVLRALRIGRRRAGLLGAACVWGYVLFIGAPDAATRAALILSLLSVGRTVGRPVAPAGALATAFLFLVLLDPGSLVRPGLQLSFTGAAGLVFAARAVDHRIGRLLPVRVRKKLPGMRRSVAAGVAATVATLPVVAWHFGRVSVVGIPTTLVGTPLVATVIPGIFGVLALAPVHAGAAAFLAGGVELLLDALVLVMRSAGTLPFSVVHVSRGVLISGLLGAVPALGLVGSSPGMRRVVRGWVVLVIATAVAMLWPLARSVDATGSVELVVLDVGQGDAIAVRSPRDRWILVDAGRGRGWASGSSKDETLTRPLRLVRELRRTGVRRLEALVLTHPDLDHVGGAPAVLRAFPVEAVIDPGRSRGTAPYLDALGAAAESRIPWKRVRQGDRWEMDGLELTVLHPTGLEPPGTDPNDLSVVILLRFGAFRALLTGDAPAEVEERLASGIGELDVLKVGHHGSRTSSSGRFLRTTRPATAVVSAGRGNRYGHPHAPVLARLREVSDTVLRTDRDGSVWIVARRDGEVRLRTERR